MRIFKRLYILPIFLSLLVMPPGIGISAVLAHNANYADLVERLMPSVVNIRTTKEVAVEPRSSFRGFRFPPNSPFHELFRDFPFPDAPPQDQEPETRQATSLGSGFIMDESGIIVTNNHVIEDADEIFVGLQSGESYMAELIGSDERTDLAVLRIIDAERAFAAISFGDSDSIRVGDPVLAIGNPLGLGGTVTSGIISARGRDINAGPYDDFIQTDASINRGNSGGPLFNDNGEVIGINTAIFSQSGGSIGIGFAIPATQAVRVIDQLLEFGTTKRGWLGVGIQNVDEEIANALGLKKAYGALISHVYEDSPAAEAGIEVGDVIISFDGKEVESSRKLPFMVAETEVDKRVRVRVWRNGKEVTLSVRLGELEKFDARQAQGQGESQAAPQSSGAAVEFAELGISVAAFSERLKDAYDLSGDSGGLVVVEVAENSEAQSIGLAAGMQLIQAGQIILRTPDDLQKAIDNVKASGLQNILLLVQAGDNKRFVTLKLTE